MNHLDYLDFEVEIGQPTGQTYPLTVLRSPAGEARATLTWPFGELALENRLKDLQIALLSSGGVRRTVLTKAEEAVQRFGAELFDLLFTGEVRNRYDVSQERVHHQEKGLRVKLRIQEPRLANLPWEFLYDARRDEYLCLSQQTPLVRYLELSQTIRPLAVTPPLRILGMIASPSDLPSLDVQVERQRLERAVAPLQDRGLVQLHWLVGATWRDLQRSMRREQWHIFHFVGHGDFDPRRDEGLIAFCNDADKAHLLTAGDLGRLLADHRTLWLSVLNACLGAQGSNRDLFASTAATLVRRGILAVVAMQQAITDAAAIEFTQTFYESLADRLPVDAAMSEARKAISFAVTNTVEWGTPVLYSRASDGHLFTMTVPAPTGAPEKQAAPKPPDANLPRPVGTRGEGDQQKPEAIVAPSRKVDSTPVAPLPAPTSVSEKQAAPKPPDANLPRPVGTRGEGDQQKPEAVVAPSRKVDSTPVTPPPAQPRTPQAGEERTLRAAGIDFPFVYVPTGPFQMGSNDYDSEKPLHTMLVDAFWLGKTPVTNAQYRPFVEGGGYNNQPFWTATGWQWCTYNKIIQPRYWTDSKWNTPQQPVVGVSWYEALAYAAWLAQVTGQPVRLPTEAEWEKGARGTDGRQYPWGNEAPDKNRCNFNRNEGKTTPVGNYLSGTSPYGALDMAGNVSEWTATKWGLNYRNYKNYATIVDNDKEGDARQALRGGAWVNNSSRVRSAYRFCEGPHDRHLIFGFRVVFALGF